MVYVGRLRSGESEGSMARDVVVLAPLCVALLVGCAAGVAEVSSDGLVACSPMVKFDGHPGATPDEDAGVVLMPVRVTCQGALQLWAHVEDVDGTPLALDVFDEGDGPVVALPVASDSHTEACDWTGVVISLVDERGEIQDTDRTGVRFVYRR
jgi:hypothetical protein